MIFKYAWPSLWTFYYDDCKSGAMLLGQPTRYHNFTLNKTNEGRYTCKIITNGTSNPLILIRKCHVINLQLLLYLYIIYHNVDIL